MASQPKRGLFPAAVLSNEPICRDHFRLALSVEGFPTSSPGQFVQLGCQAPWAESDEPDLHDWAGPSDPGLRTRSLVAPVPLLRRPFSLAGVRPTTTGAELDIIGRVVGLGTSCLSRLKAGQWIDLLGPLGNSFPLPAAAGQTALLIGGGVGIPPMIYLAEAIRGVGGQAVAIVGVTSGDLLPLALSAGAQPDRSARPTLCVQEFARHGVAAVVATDDGSLGAKGRITDILGGVLDRLALSPKSLVAYACGPERMMRAVVELTLPRGIRTWVCMERAMACGIGTCQSCVCRVRRPGESDWSYKLVCTDGPVFDGRQIVWE